jgi:ribA/ribD-fused uncharacterized protein
MASKKPLLESSGKHIFFYSHATKSAGAVFSQFYPSAFVDGSGVSYNCAEQYMMSHKALTFDDKITHAKIMAATDPKVIKALGRETKNFDDRIWDGVKFDIVVEGNRLKFTQNPDLQEILMETIGKTLVEASPYDKVWGIGLSEATAKKMSSNKWPGENLLGLALMKVRDEIKKT